jgi:hypothetical protein
MSRTQERPVLHVAVAAGRNRDRIYNDARATVPDANGGGRINAIDLKAYGVASTSSRSLPDHRLSRNGAPHRA